MKGFFVTGTGTDVGKTYVTAMIARHLRSRGRKVFAFKPVETGCRTVDGSLIGADQSVLVEAAGGWQTSELAGVYRFSPALAPAMAAGNEEISLDRIQTVFEQGAAAADRILVEGAGGWRVPITSRHDMADLASRLGLPVVIVGLATLGTINHTLLSIEAVEKTQAVAWVVLSKRPNDDLELACQNAMAIAGRWTSRVMVVGNAWFDADAARTGSNVPRETLLDRFD